MRVDPNQSSALIADMQSSQQGLSTAVSQLASGKRVAAPADDPTAFGADLRSLAVSASVDSYTTSAGTVVSQAQLADSSLSSVVTSLTQAVSLGTEGASGSITTANRAALATEVQGLLSNVLTQANSSSGSRSLFSGTAAPTSAFTADASSASGYTYNGNSGVNQTAIGDGLTVATNVPGDQIFLSSSGNVLGSLHQLVTALGTGTASDISSATAAVTEAIAHVGQQRVLYANVVNQAQSQESYLSQETLSLTSQQSALTDIDLSTAATALTQAQTAHSAILAVAAKVLPVSLLDYLK